MNTSTPSVRVAVIQAAPVYLDPDACLEKARRLIGQAASKGAAVVAFGECWLPGYPVHALCGIDTPGWWDFAAQYLESAIEIPGPETEALCQMADAFQVDIIMGVAERDPITRGSLYATQLVIGAEGEILGQHRKLRPAIHERAVFADGDGSGLQVFERGYGVLSGLHSCEHQMLLPAYALAEQGAQFHAGSWPGGETMGQKPSHQHLLSRAFAAQTGCYVMCAAGLLSPEQLPETYRHFMREAFSGDSMIIDPRGEILAGPVTGETILYANCSEALIRTAKVAFDCAGHSGRPDQLEFRNHGLEGQDGGPDDPSGFESQRGTGHARSEAGPAQTLPPARRMPGGDRPAGR